MSCMWLSVYITTDKIVHNLIMVLLQYITASVTDNKELTNQVNPANENTKPIV